MLVGTESFEKLARYELARRGVVEPRLVLVEHPLGGVSEASVAERADTAREMLAKIVESARDR